MATIDGSNGSDTLDGTIFADIINGLGGDDLIRGKASADRIRGGTGRDRMFGDAGDDSFRVFAAETEANEVYDGGSGEDELLVSSGSSPANLIADFRESTLTSIERLKFSSNAGAIVTAAFKAASFSGTGLASDLVVTGGSGVDRINITMFDDTAIDLGGLTYVNWGANDEILINGGLANETIKGSWGTDIIQPNFGVDTVLAGGGDDGINVQGTQAGDVYNGGTGFDKLMMFGVQQLFVDLTVATLTSIEAVQFIPSGVTDTMRIQLSASQFSNIGVSSSLLVASTGANAKELRISMDGETVFSAANFTFDDFGPLDTVVIVASPGTAANFITGSSQNDEIEGAAGDDVLLGGAGDDSLNGGAGDDFMFGDAGDDRYVVSEAGDVAAETLVGPDPGGKDTVTASVDATLGLFIEDLVLIGFDDIDGTGNGLANDLTGNDFANTLTGLAGNDRLTGGLGLDRLFGGLGGDRFIFNAVAESGIGNNRDRIEDFGAGDRIQLSAIDANETIAANQAFALDLDGSFSTGEIKLTVSGANTIVGLNTDADAAADSQILVIGVTDLVAANFIF
jgi:Ca2+-binding RTX toxin-like protein